LNASNEEISEQRSHKNLRDDIHRCLCLICNRGFDCSPKLLSHSFHHTGKKAFLCGLCGKRYTRILLLENHQQKVHRTLGFRAAKRAARGWSDSSQRGAFVFAAFVPFFPSFSARSL
jgi:hypothetical protein